MPTSSKTSSRRPAPKRRTQQQRRDETRAKLLDATIESLLEVGYAATTTRRVAELAGVSAGAQSHHFQYRVDMVAAAIEELASRRTREYKERTVALPADPGNRAGPMLDLVWADFNSDLFRVFVKVWAAAADDHELYTRLVAVEREVAHVISGAVRELAGDLADTPDWDRRQRVALNTMRGLALTEGFEPHDRRRRDPWPDLRETLLELVVRER